MDRGGVRDRSTLTISLSSPAGSGSPFKQMDSGPSAGLGLSPLVRHLSVFLHPHRVQRLHLCQPSHVQRHPLTPHLLSHFLLFFFYFNSFLWLMERTSAAEPSPTFLLFHIEIEMYRIYLWCSTKVHEIERERGGRRGWAAEVGGLAGL